MTTTRSGEGDALEAALALRARGVSFVMATVVRALAPTSAKPGDKAILTEDGRLEGWVGGSCAEPIVRREAQAALRDGQCRLVCITPEAEATAHRDGLLVEQMTCYSGGQLDVYLEPYLPRPRLLVFGSSPVARALAELARVMKYAVTRIDLSDAPAEDGEEVVRRLEDLPPPAPAHVDTYAVVSTHGIFDEAALEHALGMAPAYLGLVASRKRREQVLAALAARGLDGPSLARIESPAGLDLGGRRPEEIALSVMARIVALRNGADDRTTSGATSHAAAPAVSARSPSAPSPSAAVEKSCCHADKPAATK